VKASDITDEEFVRAVDRVQHSQPRPHPDYLPWATWMALGEQAELRCVPPKVALAKSRKVLKRGLVTGCGCGCRGDFEVTAAGLGLLVPARAA
jgi:hypothetical protein